MCYNIKCKTYFKSIYHNIKGYANMQEMKTFYRRATPEFPLSIYYFSASHVDKKPQPLHRNKGLMLLYMQAGEVHYYTTGGVETLHSGDICIIAPSTLHAIHTVSLQTRYTLFVIKPGLFPFPSSHYFSQVFLQPIQSGTLRFPQLLRPGMEGYEAVLAPLQQLDIRKEGTANYAMELLSVAMTVCSALYPLCKQNSESDAPARSVSEQCLQYIDRNYTQRITLADIARHVHLHPNYLCALFREQTGKSIFEQINWVRIHAASKLLRGTRLSVSQIAARCGFQNTNYFSSTFRQYLGVSPTQYRKNSQTPQA